VDGAEQVAGRVNEGGRHPLADHRLLDPHAGPLAGAYPGAVHLAADRAAPLVLRLKGALARIVAILPAWSRATTCSQSCNTSCCVASSGTGSFTSRGGLSGGMRLTSPGVGGGGPLLAAGPSPAVALRRHFGLAVADGHFPTLRPEYRPRVREIEPNRPATSRTSRPRDRPKHGSLNGLRLTVVSCPVAAGSPEWGPAGRLQDNA
jgi:hypothetical protein